MVLVGGENPPANAGDERDIFRIFGVGIFPEEGNGFLAFGFMHTRPLFYLP